MQVIRPVIDEEDRGARREGLRPRKLLASVNTKGKEPEGSKEGEALSDEDDDSDYVDSDYNISDDEDLDADSVIDDEKEVKE